MMTDPWKIVTALCGIIASVGITLGTWGLSTAQESSLKIRALETENIHVLRQLDKIEQKVDRILEKLK